MLTVKQKILVVLLKGPLQNNQIAKSVGITEQWCSKMIARLHSEGLIESEFILPRRINRLTEKGADIALRLKEVNKVD